MRRVFTLTLLLLLASATFGEAQTSADDTNVAGAIDVESLLAVGSSEWMVAAGPAFGAVVAHSAPGHKYFRSSVSWGRVLAEPWGPGVLRGRFEWAIEVVPLFSQFSPDETLGVGVTPVTWRWNFDPRGRVSPFLEVAGGLLWTGEPVPPQTTAANFTAHASYGIRYFYRPRQALVIAYLFDHISNGNRLERNPGVNAHTVQVGLSLIRPR
jgi:Lipid A 3-O-deacylase (PagL)